MLEALWKKWEAAVLSWAFMDGTTPKEREAKLMAPDPSAGISWFSKRKGEAEPGKAHGMCGTEVKHIN